MNLKILQIFQTVCEEGTITKAAKKLFMTQPAISRAIHELEIELNLQLFERYGKRIHLNESGELFLRYAQRVLVSYDDLKKSVISIPFQAKIKIGSSITIANDILPSALATFKKKYPQTPIEVVVESASNVLARLKEHQIDIALVEGIVDDKNWVQEHISSYELCIVCSKQHELANNMIITWNNILKQNWLLREKGSAARDTFESACLLHQIVLKPIWTSVNSQALLQATRENLGITILPKSIVDMYPYIMDLHVLCLEDQSLRNENHIVYDKKLFLSDVLCYLIECLKESQANKNNN